MNHREKRLMEKKLGLLKVKKELRFFAWGKEVSENIEAGKRKQEEMKEIRRLQELQAEERIANSRISYIVEDLVNSGMNFNEAQEKAKAMYEKESK